MSTSNVTYLVVGVLLASSYFTGEELDAIESQGYTDNVHKREVGNKAGLTVIHDGMGGEYTVVGKVIEKARAFDGEDLQMTDLTELPETFEAVKAQLVEHFSMTAADVRILAFTHYS